MRVRRDAAHSGIYLAEKSQLQKILYVRARKFLSLKVVECPKSRVLNFSCPFFTIFAPCRNPREFVNNFDVSFKKTV